MPFLTFGIDDQSSISGEQFRFVTLELPVLQSNEAIKIDAVDAMLESLQPDGELEPFTVRRFQLGFGSYGQTALATDFLKITDDALISEMISIQTTDTPSSGTVFNRTGIFPQFISRENPYSGRSITLGAHYLKGFTLGTTRLLVRARYNILRVSALEAAIFSI